MTTVVMSFLNSFMHWYLLIVYLNFSCTTALWPTFNQTKVQLLGLFRNRVNQSELDLRSNHTRAMFKAAILLSQQYNVKINGEYIGWRLIDSGGDVMNTFSETCKEMSASDIVGIVGPVYSREARVLAPFAAKLGVPMISYGATDPELSDRSTYPTFYRTIASDNGTALAITKLFLKYNWTSGIIIYQNDAFGIGGAQVISETLEDNNIIVQDMIVFDVVTLKIRGDLKNILMNSPSRIVILWADSVYATLVLQNALDSDVLGPHFTWILSVNAPLNSFHPMYHDKLIGILTVEHVVGSVIDAPINSTLLNAAYEIWQKYEPTSFPGPKYVHSYALFAFDATWSLIQSLQQLCSSSSSSSSSSSYVSFTNTSFCFDRLFLNSSSLLNQINRNSFLGVSGPVQFSSNHTDRTNGIYYIVNNVQQFDTNLAYIPVLVTSNEYLWKPLSQPSAIIWPGRSLTSPTSYAKLTGIILRIAIIEVAPFTIMAPMTDTNGQIKFVAVGYIPDLIEYLQNKMGFITNITCLPSTYLYNQLVDDIVNNRFDMIIGDVTVLAARREKVDFSASIFDNSLRMVTRAVPTTNFEWSAFLDPFPGLIWLSILGIILLSGLLISFYERKNNRKFISKQTLPQIGIGIYDSYGSMLGNASNFEINTVEGRILFLGIGFMSFIFISTYQANLTSDFTVVKTRGMISGLDDIKNGEVPPHRIGIVIESSIEDFFLREISAGKRTFYPLRSREEMFNQLLNNIIDVAIMDAGVLEYATTSIYCNLTLVGASFDQSAFGIMIPKNWLFQQVLDVSILSLREDGVFFKLKAKWFQTNYCSQSADSSTKVSFRQMGAPFAIFLVFVILSLLVFVFTRIFENCRKSHNNTFTRIISISTVSSDNDIISRL